MIAKWEQRLTARSLSNSILGNERLALAGIAVSNDHRAERQERLLKPVNARFLDIVGPQNDVTCFSRWESVTRYVVGYTWVYGRPAILHERGSATYGAIQEPVPLRRGRTPTGRRPPSDLANKLAP